MARQPWKTRSLVAALGAPADRATMRAAASGATRVCLVSFGSAGDLHPMLALGQALRKRGWPVTLLSNPSFAQSAARVGMDFVPVGELSHQLDTMNHPKLWHPIDGFGVMWRYLLRPALKPSYERLAELASAGKCVVVASPIAMGARLAQERLGLPLVSAYTAATMLRSVRNPMTLAHVRVAPWFPRVLRQALWRMVDRRKLEPLVRPALDAMRAELGLPLLDQSVFGRWMHSPQAGIALFPEWFASAAEDWPPQVVQAGFPLYDEPGAERAWPELAAFIESGAPPVVFMPGTARLRAGEFFAAALRACAQTGQRGLLLGAVDEALLRQLPPNVHAESYVPFRWLLRRARALVHHGGIGSCAQALRAGIPQLVIPQAYDQFDNAMRLEHLGVAREIGGTGGLASMGEQLKALLASPAVARACGEWAAEATPRAARHTIADLVERFA
jgi:rhamnosyltransferase subunit B